MDVCSNTLPDGLTLQINSSQINKHIHQVCLFAQSFEEYLAAADIAVQLRGSSRGETSKAVLDCLAYRLPVILNANGSMAEYPNTAVYKLQDDFSEMELVQALELLKANHEERQRLSAGAQAALPGRFVAA